MINQITVPPMLWIPHQLVGVSEGFDVTLECFSEAHPTSLNYWTKGDGQMIHVSQKYRYVCNLSELEFLCLFRFDNSKMGRSDVIHWKNIIIK